MKKIVAAGIALMIAGSVSVWAADAKANWTKHCAKCHGADGKGQTAMGKKLNAKDYTDPKVQASLKDEEMFKATKEGVKDKSGKVTMKGFADALSDEEIKDLVKHIRSFKK
jgi:cytochrome c6